MPLTRHFYSMDEVQASFYYCVSSGRVEESLFWCQELIDSGYIGETISLLFESWLWNVGPFCIQWLLNAYTKLHSEELSETDILDTTYQLACIPHKLRDSSLWNIIILGSSNEIPDRLVRKYPNSWKCDNIVETHFISAIYQGKTLNAWWISQSLDNTRIWEMLEWYSSNIITSEYGNLYKDYFKVLKDYSNLLGFQTNGTDSVIRCVAICGLCISESYKKESFDKKWIKEIDDRTHHNIDIWCQNIGKKCRRIFKIQTSCLYGKTQRGEMRWSQNTLPQLYDVEKHLYGCPFWDEVITSEYESSYNNNDDNTNNNKDIHIIEWKSDEVREAFYDKYFPDDIPDEWSKEEKLKSHGDGILGPTDVVNIWKYSRHMFNNKSRLLWGSKSKVEKILEKDKSNYSDCNLYSYIENLYKNTKKLSMENLKKLEPVHKVLQIKGRI